jgi:hypothetical protein
MSSRGSWRRCSSGSVGRSCAISCKRGAPTPKAGPATGRSRPRLIRSRCWDSPDSSHQVQEAADASGVSVAAWGRHAMRQVTLEGLPLRWRAGETVPRPHDSPVSQRCFTLRLDEKTSRTLAPLTQTFHRPAAQERLSRWGWRPRFHNRDRPTPHGPLEAHPHIHDAEEASGEGAARGVRRRDDLGQEEARPVR